MLHSVQCEACYLRPSIPLGWSFAEAFSPPAPSEDARTHLESLQGFFFFPPPGIRRYDLNANGGLTASQVAAEEVPAESYAPICYIYF